MANDIKKYICDACHYTSMRKNNYDKHINTEKHAKNTFKYIRGNNKIINKEIIFVCSCGIEYKQRQSLSRHKQKCKLNNIITQEIIYKLLEQNNNLTNLITCQTKEMHNNITNITNNTTCKNKFNIHIFLNEKCKNAISINQFIQSIQISLQNLLVTKDKGLIEGITNIFIENMKKLPITERPLHCTDTKREVIYVKNENWEKDENNEHIKEAIKRVSNIQSKNINIFKNEKPNFMKNQKDKDDYIELVKNATDDIKENDSKIIKKLCKNIYIYDNL